MLNVALAALLILPPLAMIERRRAEKSQVDRAIRKGVTCLKIKPRVLVRIQVKRTQDNSNSSYAALGMRAVPVWWPPPSTPAWLRNPACRLGQAVGAIQTLKEAAWKVILAGVV